MKKTYIIGLFALLGIFHACKKDTQLIDGKRPEERINESLEKYKKELVGSVNGWKGYLYTDVLGGGYNFYFNFKENDRVGMKADYNITTAGGLAKESTYQIKQVMVPTLTFDTYNYLHLLTDPDPSKFGGLEGSGYGSDFEFEIREQVGDTLKLVGKKRQTPFTLIKASAADKEFYTTAAFPDLVDGIGLYLAANPFLYFTDPKDNTKKIQFSANTNVAVRALTLSLLDNGVVSSEKAVFSFSSTGLLLRSPLAYAGLNIVGVDFDKESKKLALITSTGTKVPLLTSPTAIIPLHLLLGNSLHSFDIPGDIPLPGSSDLFVGGYNQVKSVAASQYSSTISDFSFEFNKNAKTFTISFYLIQGGTVFQAIYTYDYTKTENGEFKFSNLAASGGAGPALLSVMRASMLNTFSSNVFTVDYFGDLENRRILGKMTSKQTPAFSFTGILN